MSKKDDIEITSVEETTEEQETVTPEVENQEKGFIVEMKDGKVISSKPL